MSLRPTISPSTLVALVLASITAAAVTFSLLDGDDAQEAMTATGAPARAVADRASDLMIEGADGDELAMRGTIRLTVDEPVAGATASTRPIAAGECPVMTDSIRRLYLGFLDREPTADELTAEIDRYRTGEANLEDIADALAASGRFRTEYGPLSDDQYTERVYLNTVGIGPNDVEQRHWAMNLDNGYPRGSVMLAFTESADFVDRTATSRPLSGYLSWYPRGTHWYCGAGPVDDLAVLPLTDGAVYADHLFINPGDRDTVTSLSTVLDGRQRVPMMTSTLPAGFTDYRWDGLFVGADHYGDAIDVTASDDTGWVVVFYPRSVGEQRLGWHVPW